MTAPFKTPTSKGVLPSRSASIARAIRAKPSAICSSLTTVETMSVCASLKSTPCSSRFLSHTATRNQQAVTPFQASAGKVNRRLALPPGEQTLDLLHLRKGWRTTTDRNDHAANDAGCHCRVLLN